jgi:uncharacterized protein (TIGR02145 family)
MRQKIVHCIALITLLHIITAGGCKKEDAVPPPPDTGTVTDVEGNVYKTIKIGTQVWMAENLKTTKYRNGETISPATSETGWANLALPKLPGYCYSFGNGNNTAVYGLLYNWPAVNDARGLAPAGWHIPTHEEWQTLIDFLGGRTAATAKMKEAGTAHWDNGNTGNNSSGFTAVAAGVREYQGRYLNYGGLILRQASWWSATAADLVITPSAWIRDIQGEQSVYGGAFLLNRGISVRCVKD